MRGPASLPCLPSQSRAVVQNLELQFKSLSMNRTSSGLWYPGKTRIPPALHLLHARDLHVVLSCADDPAPPLPPAPHPASSPGSLTAPPRRSSSRPLTASARPPRWRPSCVTRTCLPRSRRRSAPTARPAWPLRRSRSASGCPLGPRRGALAACSHADQGALRSTL